MSLRSLCLFIPMVFWFSATSADVEAGLAWLQDRDSADGVHRAADITVAVDTNQEAWFTLFALSATNRLPQLDRLVLEESDDSLSALARQALIRLEQGRSPDVQLALILSEQGSDGGFPVFPGHGSEALTTAWVLRVLDRAGRGTGTAASRALGFLLASQLDDGGWSAANGNPGSVYVSAIVATSLTAYRNRFDLAQSLGRAAAFLQATRQADGSYGEVFITGIVVEAFVALGIDRSEIIETIALLEATQQPNGSFNDDAFETAIALRALAASMQAVTSPAQSGITGRVLAADTGLPISGASLTLTGADNALLLSNNRGEFFSTTLTAGTYTAVVSFDGMRPVQFDITLTAGRLLDLGDIRMVQVGGDNANLGLIRGRVTSAEDGEPIVDARISLTQPPIEVRTDGQGRYQMLQIPAGEVAIQAEAINFSHLTTVVTVEAGGVVELSISLAPDPNPVGMARVRGTATHGQDGSPLTDVEIQVVSGAPPASVTTDEAGVYELLVDADGLVALSASKAGFDSVDIESLLVPDQILNFSPQLYPEGETPDDANRSDIVGVVVNQANRQPIANALIVAVDPSGQQAARSDGDGVFGLTGLVGPTTRLTISADAFESASLVVPLLPLESRDLGQIGLKPTTLEFYFPDLAVTATTLVETDPDTFFANDEILVTVANRGTSGLTQDFSLVAFVDANGNLRFDPGLEPEVGRVRVNQDLPVGSSTETSIAIAAQLAFRDAPVALWVDADNEVPEQDEDNNMASTLLGCRVTPAFIGDDTIFEAWRWEGLSTNPLVNSVNQVPVVGQLNDDNSDGQINQFDIPDVVFVAGLRNTAAPSITALVALSGDDGRELWTRTDIRLSQFTSLALGDIDNDGVAEIIAVRNYRQELIAFENDGAIKWRTPLDGPGVPAVLFPPPPFVYDMPVIVNLEGDNEAEVILGREAFRGLTGEQLWEGEFDGGGIGSGVPMFVTFGLASVSADVNLDGVMEVIAGRTLYDFAGNAIWHRDDIRPDLFADVNDIPRGHSGLVAVANFDLDDFPEIVLTIDNEMHLLQHDGQSIWGPVKAPDFGELGAPSVADLDDDGLPEVIVSSNTRLTVFESDGTIKWTADILDQSGVTSATVFDFENDGLFELVHVDENDFRIFDALTGTQLFETRHTSRTVLEYPVVADIDGDKQAEVLLTGFDDDFVAGTTPGLRVFKARNGAWADAGSVWGSQAFHINEVNEDSTVPLLETPSWLTHNTYRVQRSPEPDPLGLPDFTVGDLRLIDRGPGLDPVVQVRVGNAGPVDAHEPPFLGVYRGDPDAGGVLLSEVRLDTLRAGRFQIADLGAIPTIGNGELYAVIDQPGLARECREGNNRRVIAFQASNGAGQLQLSADNTTFQLGERIDFTATVTNLGRLDADFSVTLEVRDPNNKSTQAFNPLAFAGVGAGLSTDQIQAWPTGGVLGGAYTLIGRLIDSQNNTVDTAMLGIVIAGDTSGPAGALRIVTDRAAYVPGEPVTLTYLVQNPSDNNVIRRPELGLALSGPGGTQQLAPISLNDLFPGATISGEISLDQAGLAGSYVVDGSLRSALSGQTLAEDDAGFERLSDPSAELLGSVEATLRELFPGQVQSCLFTVRTQGTLPQFDVPIRQRVVSLDVEQVILEDVVTSDLAPGIDYVASETIATTGLAGAYACVLETARGDDWRVLDFAGFDVLGTSDPGVSVTPTSGLITSESGQSAQFTVVLTAPPSDEVRIALEPSDVTEWSLPLTELRFTASSWDVPRTVTVLGLDDNEVDGSQSGTIRLLPAISSDPDYAGLDPDDVAITNADDDSAEIVVSPTTLATTESGTTATFQVQLSQAPSAEVRIDLLNSDPSEWSLSTNQVLITAADWQNPHPVTVTGVDDSEFDGPQQGLIELLAAQSDDPNYAGFDPADVMVSNADNETADIIVTPTEVTTSETGSNGSFTVGLNTEPTAEVVIVIGVVDASEWQILATEVRLDASNWDTGQTIAVVAVDDAEPDGDQTATLSLLPAQSSDTRFNGLDPSDVQLTNVDDDTARIVVAPTTGLVVDEGGSTASFEVSLSVAPGAEVSVSVTSGDSSEFEVSPSALTFSIADGTNPQTVTVTGVDDDEVDGNILGQIVLAPAISTDLRFHGFDPQNVTVSNADNETAQIVVAPNAPLETDESGSSATVRITLTAAPSAEVAIGISSTDVSEWVVDQSNVIFTPTNWSDPQLLIVSGVDDDETDGDVVGLIRLAPAVSADNLYAGFKAPDIAVINRDNDQAGITLSLLGPDVIAEGESAQLELRLAARPTARLNLRFNAVAASGGSALLFALSPTEMIIDPENWQLPQQLTLSTEDNGQLDQDQFILIAISDIDTTDTAYSSLSVGAAQIQVIDNGLGNPTPAPIPINGAWTLGLLAVLLLLTARMRIGRHWKEKF